MQGGGSRTGIVSHKNTRINIPIPAPAPAAGVVVSLSSSSSSSLPSLKIQTINRSISGLPAYTIIARYSRLAIANTNNTLHTQSISMQLPLPVPKKKMKSRLITISTSDGKWHGNWNCDYTFFLRQFLDDDDVDKDTEVTISLCIQKHAGLGMSVEGTISTCFTRKCCHCCTPYLRHIDSPFKVWILPSSRSSNNNSRRQQMNITSTELSLEHENYTSSRSDADIVADDDPSLSLQNSTSQLVLYYSIFIIYIYIRKTRLQVIYVKPGSEADLDSLIQDTIRLATSVKETCSEACENSEPKLQHLGVQNAASIERRWYKLLELKKNIT